MIVVNQKYNNMKQKTAVEWLAKELESFGDPGVCEITWEDLDSLVEQAKDIEKIQINDAYANGQNDRLKNIIRDYYDDQYNNK